MRSSDAVSTILLLAAVFFAITFELVPDRAQAHHQFKRFSGLASFYSIGYQGLTADGERYDSNKFTAAHRTLPFGTVLRVTDEANGRSVTVTVNDRGPFIHGRVLDLSLAAAKALHIINRGVAKVTAVAK